MVLANDDEVKSLSANETNNAGDGGKKCSHKNINENQNKKRKSPVPDTSSNADNEDLFKLFIDASKKLGQQVKRTLYFVLIDLGGKQVIDRFAQWCVQHPQLAICLLVAALVAFLPILMFAAFALSTFVLALTGFLVLEGTLLTVITMITFGLFSAVGIFLCFCAFVGLATYFGVSQVYDMYGKTATQRTNLRNFMDKYNRKIISVPNADERANDNNPRQNDKRLN